MIELLEMTGFHRSLNLVEQFPDSCLTRPVNPRITLTMEFFERNTILHRNRKT